MRAGRRRRRAGARAGRVARPTPSALGSRSWSSTAIEGETIARKILRDPRVRRRPPGAPGQLGRALAVCTPSTRPTVPGLPTRTSCAVPRRRSTSSASRTRRSSWSFAGSTRAPPRRRPARRLVHGDFRLGNVIVGPDGLRAVLDWELGPPRRPDGRPRLAVREGVALRLAASGRRCRRVRATFEAYEEAAVRSVDPDVVRWWEVLGTLKWGIMCIMPGQQPPHRARAAATSSRPSADASARTSYDLFLRPGGTLVMTVPTTCPRRPSCRSRARVDGRDVHGRHHRPAAVPRPGRVNMLAMVERELALGAQQARRTAPTRAARLRRRRRAGGRRSAGRGSTTGSTKCAHWCRDTCRTSSPSPTRSTWTD